MAEKLGEIIVKAEGSIPFDRGGGRGPGRRPGGPRGPEPPPRFPGGVPPGGRPPIPGVGGPRGAMGLAGVAGISVLAITGAVALLGQAVKGTISKLRQWNQEMGTLFNRLAQIDLALAGRQARSQIAEFLRQRRMASELRGRLLLRADLLSSIKDQLFNLNVGLAKFKLDILNTIAALLEQLIPLLQRLVTIIQVTGTVGSIAFDQIRNFSPPWWMRTTPTTFMWAFIWDKVMGWIDNLIEGIVGIREEAEKMNSSNTDTSSNAMFRRDIEILTGGRFVDRPGLFTVFEPPAPAPAGNGPQGSP